MGWGADSKRIWLLQALDGKKRPSLPPPLPALARSLLPLLIPLLLSLFPLLQSFLSPLLLVLCSLPFLLPPALLPHPFIVFPPDAPDLQAQGCSPAEFPLRGSAAPPSGQSRTAAGSPTSGRRGSFSASCRRHGGDRPPGPVQCLLLPPAASGLAALGRPWHHYQRHLCLP